MGGKRKQGLPHVWLAFRFTRKQRVASRLVPLSIALILSKKNSSTGNRTPSYRELCMKGGNVSRYTILESPILIRTLSINQSICYLSTKYISLIGWVGRSLLGTSSLFFTSFMASEDTSLLSTASEDNGPRLDDVYLRFSSTRKSIILAMVSACTMINCTFNPMGAFHVLYEY